MALTTAIGFGLAGTAMQANAAVQAGKYNRDLSNYNAQIGEYRADQAISRGKREENQFRQKVRSTIGAQRTALAGQNVQLDTGTPLQVQQDTAFLGELDALTIRNNAALEAWGYRTGAASDRLRGKVAYATGRNQAMGTLLTGGANAAQSYLRYG